LLLQLRRGSALGRPSHGLLADELLDRDLKRGKDGERGARDPPAALLEGDHMLLRGAEDLAGASRLASTVLREAQAPSRVGPAGGLDRACARWWK
jgi:hypothetical protein